MPTVNYLWNPINDSIIKEFDDAGSTIAEYTTEPDGSLISEHRSGVTYQHHYDGQGNTRALTNDQGEVTDTFAYTSNGELTERTGTTPTPIQFGGEHGYHTDQTTGQIMARRRAFSHRQGRWLSVDPLAILDDPNLYRYANNNPVNLIDPSGLIPLGPGGAVPVCSSTDWWWARGWKDCIYRTNKPPFPPEPITKNGCTGPTPDRPFPGVDWKPACDKHDVCYQTCGKSQSECDDRLWQDWVKACEQVPDEEIRRRCTFFADFQWTYIYAVGMPLYQNEQNRVCKWEKCCCPDWLGGG